MLGLGRRGLRDCIARCSAVRVSQSEPLLSLTSVCPPMPVSYEVRTFASQSKYDSQGDMSAVTFHGPRSVKVSRKAKPKIEEPGVSANAVQERMNKAPGLHITLVLLYGIVCCAYNAQQLKAGSPANSFV